MIAQVRTAALLVALVLTGFAVSTLGAGVPALLGGLAFVIGLFALPVGWLPSLGLALFVLFPVKHLPGLDQNGTINPCILIVVVWALRFLVQRTSKPVVMQTAAAASISMLWISLATFSSSIPSVSFGWSANFAVLVLIPAMIGMTKGQADQLKKTWIILGSVLGCYAFVEVMVLKANPLYDWAFSNGASSIQQVWSVYRATTTLGHPLLNATFFALGAVLAVDGALEHRTRNLFAAVALNFTGVVLSGSRGGFAATVAGAVVVICLRSRFSERRTRAASAGLLGALLLCGLSLVGLANLSDRNGSGEGSESAAYRRETLTLGIQMAKEAPVLGVGPGLSDYKKREFSSGLHRSSGLENSWIQLLVSLGGFGLVLVIWLCAGLVKAAWRSRNLPALGCLVTYVIMAASFNLIEANRPALILFGIIAAMTLSLPQRRASGNTVSGELALA